MVTPKTILTYSKFRIILNLDAIQSYLPTQQKRVGSKILGLERHETKALFHERY